MDVVADLPADPQSARSVDPGVRALYHPADSAEAGAVWCAALGDDGLDAALRRRQRDVGGFADRVVLGARLSPVDRTPSGCGPSLSARTWELSITAREVEPA